MNRTKYLLQNTVLFGLGSIGTKLISVFMVPLYTYALSKSQYGTTDLIFTISMVMTPFVCMNIHEAIMRYCLDKHADRNKIISTGMAIFLIGSIISIVIIPICYLIPSLYDYSVYLYLLVVGATAVNVGQAFLKGIEKLKIYTASTILNTALTATLNIIFLVVLKWGITGYFLAFIISYFATALFCFCGGKIFYYLKGFSFHWREARGMMRYSLALVPNSLLWWVTNSSGRIIITVFLGTGANGLYAIANKIPTLLNTFVTIFQQAWQFSAIKSEDEEDKDAYNNKMFRVYYKLILLASSFLILVLKPIMMIYVSSEFFESWMYSPALILAFTFGAFSTFIGTYYTVAKNNVGMMLSAFCGAVVNIIFTAILVPAIGIQGASLASCASYFSIFLYRSFGTKKYMPLRVFTKQFIIGNLILVGECCFIYLPSLSGYIINAAMFILMLIICRESIFLIKDLMMKIVGRSAKKIQLFIRKDQADNE